MRLVVAIGNPGVRYFGTRHNVGFAVVDAVARRVGRHFRKASPHHMEAELEGGLLVKPVTYVNRTGTALEPLLERFDLEDLLVVVDDVNLDLGRLRVRAKGSHGGHNGLRDVERVVGSAAYGRLRIGVAPSGDEPFDLDEHVLGPFGDNETDTIGRAVERAADCVQDFLGGATLERLMPLHNGYDPEARAREDEGAET